MKPVANKENILKAAIFVFSAHGEKKTSMALIAKTAKVSKPLLFHHFGSKNKLFKACQQFANEQIHAIKDLPLKGLSFFSMIHTIYQHKLTLEIQYPGIFDFLQLDQINPPILPTNPMTKLDRERLKPDIHPDHLWQTLYYLTIGYQSALKTNQGSTKTLLQAFEKSLALFEKMATKKEA